MIALHRLQAAVLQSVVLGAGAVLSSSVAATADGCSDPLQASVAMVEQKVALPVAVVPTTRLDATVREACTVSVADYLRDRAKLVVVDTRERAERQRLRIPGALTLAATEVEARAFLKNEVVVLVGGGVDDRSLLEKCAGLRQNAWNARVLIGGVRTLARANQALDGTRDALDALDWLTPADLHRLVLAAPTRVVLLGVDASATTLPGSLSGAERWPANANSVDAARSLKKTAESLPETALAVVTADAVDRRGLQSALWTVGADRVFVLREGISTYVTYLDEQRHIAAHAYSALKRPCGAG